ncbi:MAG: NAD-dependent succinate-semialdehyde dehydrogenase [Pirellulaceae bacterium]|nr:NAD-dependent succinate-semialdehyde dehydrogenase [Pirellulaceae bacterium]
MNWEQLRDSTLFRSQALIAGQWCDADSGQTLRVLNPATGQCVGLVPDMGETETCRAIQAARDAWPAWRQKTAHERAEILRRWRDLMLEHADDLALILTTEQGKPLREARGEIVYAASFAEWYAEEGKRVGAESLVSPLPGKRTLVLKQPVGVCAAITPWNFPAAMITRKVAPALAAGCPMIVKPSELTPLTALAIAHLAAQAGVPDGVLQVVTGQPQPIGKQLTTHPDVRKFSFTGSTAVGRLLAQQCASTIKRLSLELGGHAPFIVFDDADLDAAVQGAIASKYRNNGQTCICTNRFFVHDAVYDRFLEKLLPLVRALKVGPGCNPGVDLGPLINQAAVAKVERHIQDAVGQGAQIVVGGKRHALGGGFFEPTVLSGIQPQMLVAREETFGPVSPLIRFTDDAQVVELANDTQYGLAAYFFSRDIGRVWRVAEGLEYGMVGVNTGLITSETVPFGGMKQSGIGREGSRQGIEEYLEVKYVCIAL